MKKSISNYPYSIKKRRETHIGRFVVVQDQIEIAGEKYPYSFERSEDGVIVLPVINEEIILIRQFRHALGEWLWEFPAGGVAKKNPDKAAKDELLEETGYIAGNMDYLGWYYISQGLSTMKTFFYIAYCDKLVGQRCEPTEFIEVHIVSKDKMEKMVSNHIINNIGTVMLWELFKQRL